MNKEFKITSVDTIRFFNLKDEKNGADKATSLVRFKVLDNQLSGLLKALPIEEFETAHPGANFWTASEEELSGLTVPIDKVIETRGNALTVKAAIAELPYGLDAWNALTDSDKAFIIIEAHKTAPGVVLDKALFRAEKGADLTGFEKAVKDAYNAGMSPATRKALINACRVMFFKVVGNGGELFDGLSLTRSELGKADLMHFCASFGGRAKRPTNKDKDGTVIVGNYDYQLKAGSWKTQSQAMTTLLGVIIESRKADYCKVIRR